MRENRIHDNTLADDAVFADDAASPDDSAFLNGTAVAEDGLDDNGIVLDTHILPQVTILEPNIIFNDAVVANDGAL